MLGKDAQNKSPRTKAIYKEKNFLGKRQRFNLKGKDAFFLIGKIPNCLGVGCKGILQMTTFSLDFFVTLPSQIKDVQLSIES